MVSMYRDCIDFYNKKVNLLIVDDDPHLRNSLIDVFYSPVFNITTLATLGETIKVIGNNPELWHCWIVDIDLGHGKNGLDLLSRHSQFPFVVVLSGLQSMSLADDAIRLGALRVFDKDPASIERLYDAVCKTATLGYVLGGKPTKYLKIFQLMGDSVFKTANEWAEKACISLRQLHRICDMHPLKNPRSTLSLYYSLYALLWNGSPDFSGQLPPCFNTYAEYIAECMRYTFTK